MEFTKHRFNRERKNAAHNLRLAFFFLYLVVCALFVWKFVTNFEANLPFQKTYALVIFSVAVFLTILLNILRVLLLPKRHREWTLYDGRYSEALKIGYIAYLLAIVFSALSVGENWVSYFPFISGFFLILGIWSSIIHMKGILILRKK